MKQRSGPASGSDHPTHQQAQRSVHTTHVLLLLSCLPLLFGCAGPSSSDDTQRSTWDHSTWDQALWR